MAEIIVCFKEVVDEKEIKVNPKTQTLITEGIARKISDFDLNAIEEGVGLKEQHGGTVTGLILGPPDSKTNIKRALSMGLDRACLLSDPAFEKSDSITTARILTAAIKKLGSFDLVICGEASTDGFAAQVGPGIAEGLDIPQITGATKVDIKNGSLVAERMVEEGIEVVEASFPLLITVTKEINKPRLATLKQIMQASKKEIKEWRATDLGLSPDEVGEKGSGIKIRQISVFKMERKNIIIEGELSEAVGRAVRELAREGVF